MQLAKLQDRFRHRVDLAPSDIREVATKRVLAKKDDAVPVLSKLYGDHQGQLNAALRLERTTRKTEINEADFVHFYPYPPHYIDLCIGIMSGIRLQPGAPRHYGGSNRTIIKQAYEMLVSDRTAMAQQPIGTLVTLDKVSGPFPIKVTFLTGAVTRPPSIRYASVTENTKSPLEMFTCPPANRLA